MRQVDIQARSVEDAVDLALEQLGRTRDQVKVEVLATDPGGDEVLVRVIAPDLPGVAPNEEVPVRNRRAPGMRDRGGDRMDRGDRGGRGERIDRGNRTDQMERPPRGNRFGRPGPAPSRMERPIPDITRTEPLLDEELADDYGNRMDTEVLLDSSLQTVPLAPGEHATPQDAVAPVAAEVLQKILQGMRMRGLITRRYPAEEGEAAFEDDQDSLVLNVTGLNERDQGILIGRRGETLDALQFLLNLIVGRQVDLWARVIVDVEGYRLRRKLALINLAKRTADQVESRHQAIPLEAMPAYERRIVHMTLADHPTVTTESSGAEPERRVVVLPK